MSYEIVRYTPEFKDQVVNLLRHLWSTDLALNRAHLEWKHEHNPYVPEPLIYIALSDGQVVGMRAMFGAKWELGRDGETLVGLCAGDLVIAPEHRNKGLFTQIMALALDDLARRGYSFVFNLSSSPVTHLSSLTSGWRGIGSLKPLQWRCADRGGTSKHAAPFDVLDSSRDEAVRSSQVSVEVEPRPKAMTDLIGRIENRARLRHVRDEEYFAWRFRNPRAVYRFLYSKGSRLEGYLIVRTSGNPEVGKKAGVEIVDWEASSLKTRAELLNVLLQWGRFDRLTIWSATLPQEDVALLDDANFQPLEWRGSLARARPTVLVRPVRDEMLKDDWMFGGRHLLDPDSWDLRMIYSDGQ